MTMHQIIERECAKNFGKPPYYGQEELRAILQEAIEPYRKDSERMDFVTLHGQHFEIYKLAGKFAVRYKSPFPDKAGYGWFDSPREAIDAAIAAAKING